MAEELKNEMTIPEDFDFDYVPYEDEPEDFDEHPDIPEDVEKL